LDLAQPELLHLPNGLIPLFLVHTEKGGGKRMNSRLTDDSYVRIFNAKECAIIQFALLDCYKRLKNYDDEWHKEQRKKMRNLLIQKFETLPD
jgi:hypothetical protein